MKKDLIIWLLLSAFCMLSCQRELHFPQVPSEGSLQKNDDGDCLPKSIRGDFIKGESLSSSSGLTVDVDVTSIGSYNIYSDTVNGYHFEASGDFTSTGIHHVELTASGNPVNSGTNEFNIRYNNSICQISILVEEVGSSGNSAVYTLGGAPDNCTAVVDGIYLPGIALDASNTVTITVDVTVAGDYSISTPAVNGISFSKTGTFTTTGTNTIVLNGSGLPLMAGSNVFPVTAGSSNCSFEVAVGDSTIGFEFTADISPNVKVYQGTTNDAVQRMFNNQAILTITGTTLDGTCNFSLTLSNTDGIISTGIYSGTNNFGKFAAFSFSDSGPLLLLGGPTFASNLPVELTTYDPVGHFVEGTFRGFVSQGFGKSMEINYGKFKARFP